jgi:hypothetical protein
LNLTEFGVRGTVAAGNLFEEQLNPGRFVTHVAVMLVHDISGQFPQRSLTPLCVFVAVRATLDRRKHFDRPLHGEVRKYARLFQGPLPAAAVIDPERLKDSYRCRIANRNFPNGLMDYRLKAGRILGG